MYCILNIGMTGQGKSNFVKGYIAKRNCFVFDVQKEYNDLSDNWTADRARHLQLNEKLFIQQCSQRKNTICVFEEATGFFEGRQDRDMRRLILSKRHTGNIYIFCFHSISAVPPRIMQLTNYVVLFRTMDEPYQVEGKFPSLYPYYLKAKNLKQFDYLTVKTIPQ